ncbi:MAG: GNAT family N-acetyltransferase [Candidatus Sericytochromatia bacterium]|nr:GNAT family N-acetyltransferase [Candidatus Tanganyikabacteria bacterium]
MHTTLNRLPAGEVRAFARFTFPRFRSLLAEPQADPIWAIGAECGREPVGLALARTRSNGEAEVLSLFVSRPFRAAGLGTRLLSRLESELCSDGSPAASATYIGEGPTSPALERILRNLGWTAPMLQTLVGTADLLASRPGWIGRLSPPERFEPFPWSGLSEADRRAIRDRQGETLWYPEILSPFRWEDPPEPCNSLGLRWRGEVVGWVIAHRLRPEKVRYSSLFVDSRLQGTGRAVELLSLALARQIAAGIPLATFGVDARNEPMLRLVNRHFRPYLTSLRPTFGVRKRFDPS